MSLPSGSLASSLPRALTMCLTLALILPAATSASAQVKSPAQRLSELEDRVKDLEKEVKKLEKEKADAKDDKNNFAAGIMTRGGVEFQLGGKVELRFIDTEDEDDPQFGTTDEPDPHVEFNRLRLNPRLRFNRHIRARGQIDFKPNRARLKEFTVRHRVQPVWWFRSNLELGLDDRFIRPNRRTRNYPLIGNAFWRDESLGAIWAFKFGDRQGKPDSDKASDPFDFASNWGAVTLSVSGGQGYALDSKEVGFDRAPFNDIVQDDRNVRSDLSISEVGVGLEYRRDFAWLGDIRFMGFFYHDRLNDASRDFLQQDLTVRGPSPPGGGLGPFIAGYGDSNSRKSQRYGFGAQYFLPAETLFGAFMKTRRRDGVRVQGQWIRGDDGELERSGWYVQGSYRYSFPERLIAGRYFRSIEPIVRYGTLDTDLGPEPLLPGTWDRRQFLVGMITEVTNEVIIRVEYTFNSEDTGTSRGVKNDELMVELLLLF